MDITEVIQVEMTQTGWTKKGSEIQEVFIWSFGPEALQKTRAEYKTALQNTASDYLADLSYQKGTPTTTEEN